MNANELIQKKYQQVKAPPRNFILTNNDLTVLMLLIKILIDFGFFDRD
jgi:hypothetical protein